MNPIFLCSVCSGAVTAQTGVLHAIEQMRAKGVPGYGEPLQYFAFYKWNQEAAESGDFHFVHAAEECIGEQIDRYLARFSWGTIQRRAGSQIIGPGSFAGESVISECERYVDNAMIKATGAAK